MLTTLCAQANSLYDEESPLFDAVEGHKLILGGAAWHGISRILSCDESVKELQLGYLQAPFKALFDEQGCKPSCATFAATLKPLVAQLVVRLKWLWKKNLLKVQEGFLSHKSTSI